MKQCHKCGTLIKNSTHFHRHVKRCGTSEHRAQCPFCPKSYSRNDNLKKHIKQKHPVVATPSLIPGFTCEKCQKKFSYEMALKVHKDHCGVDKPKPFKCTTCGKSFTRRATLEDHQKAHQVGGGVKRKASEQDTSPKTRDEKSDLLPF